MTIEFGDKVMHKSGGPLMVVNCHEDKFKFFGHQQQNHVWIRALPAGLRFKCSWFIWPKYRTFFIAKESLIKKESTKGTRTFKAGDLVKHKCCDYTMTMTIEYLAKRTAQDKEFTLAKCLWFYGYEAKSKLIELN